MYFDGQLHYLDRDTQSPMSQKASSGTQYQSAATTDPTSSSSTPQPSQTMTTGTNFSPLNPSMPKSQTVSGAASDLHSMALKSAINNIGIFL
jgi:hypothetical protein